MQDMIPAGTGNSRYLKSVSDFLTQYPNYEAFAAALIAGTLPIDLNGLNLAGITQEGTPLNKSTLLSDATAASIGLLQSDPTVDNALAGLAAKAAALQTAVDGKQAALTFDANPTSGSSNPVRSSGVYDAVTTEGIGVSSSRALVLADAGEMINVYGSNAAVTITIPAHTNADFPMWTEVLIWRNDTHAVTIAPASGVTLRSPEGITGSRKIAGQYGVACLKKVAADTWMLFGDLE